MSGLLPGPPITLSSIIVVPTHIYHHHGNLQRLHIYFIINGCKLVLQVVQYMHDNCYSTNLILWNDNHCLCRAYIDRWSGHCYGPSDHSPPATGHHPPGTPSSSQDLSGEVIVILVWGGGGRWGGIALGFLSEQGSNCSWMHVCLQELILSTLWGNMNTIW